MNNEDNIHKAFKEKFDPKNITNQGWNEPSDVIWDRISDDLDGKKKFKGAWLYLISSCLLLSMIGLGVMFNKIQTLSNEISSIQTELEVCGHQAQINSSQLQNLKSTSKDILPVTIIKNNTKLSENIPTDLSINHASNNSKITTNSDVTAKNNIAVTSTTNQLHNSTNPTISSSKKVINRNYKDLSQNKNLKRVLPTNNSFNKSKTIISAAKIEANTNKNIVSNDRLVSAKISQSIIPTFTEPIKPKKIDNHSLSINSGVLFYGFVNEGDQETALSELIDKEYAKSGLFFDAMYTNALSSKLSIGAGLGISSQEFVTEYDITLPYNTGQEVLENGIGHIDFEHSLPTSFGNSDTKLTLVRTRANEPLQESDVRIDFNTSHKLISLRMPIVARYHFSDDHLGLFFGLTGIPTYILSANSGISSVISQHSSISSEKNSSSSNYESIKRINFSVGLNIGYIIPFSENQNFNFNLGYHRNISSHYNTENFSSTLHGIDLSAGYLHKF